MKIENPLTREFLLNYPADAARALEMVSADHVAALFKALPAQTGVPAITAMLPAKAAAVLGLMATLPAARLLAALPIYSAARIYRLLDAVKQDELAANLSKKNMSQIHHYLEYPPGTAGTLLNPNVTLLTEPINVGDAIRRIERIGHPINCDVYIIDNAQHLVGMIDLGGLLTANHHARLQEIMSRKTYPVPAFSKVATLLLHPGWATQRSLPVVNHDNTVAGVLDYSRLQEATAETGVISTQDPLDNLLSMAGSYWLGVAQMMVSMLSITRSYKGDDHER